MWRLLRDRRLHGLEFRRQFPIGPFIADFCCYEIRLVIDLGGEVHESAQQSARDQERDPDPAPIHCPPFPGSPHFLAEVSDFLISFLGPARDPL